MSNATSFSLAFPGLDALLTQLAILDENGVTLRTSRAQRRFGAEHDYQGDNSSVDTNYLGVYNLSADADTTTASEGIRAVTDDDRGEFSFEYPCEASEERLWFAMWMARFTDDGETYVQIAYLDTTDREHAGLGAEEEAERLRNLVRMLPHDLGSLPSVVVDYVKSLLDKTAASDRLERVTGALDRMDDIIIDALALARHDTVEGLSTVDLGIRTAAAWEHIETGTAMLVAADSIESRADSDLLGHVLENLFRNSAEHGASDDDLTVAVSVLDGNAVETGSYVEDDGVGIPTKTRDVVFEAGYSTGKERTGLGLSVVARTVRTHDWDVAVTEAEGDGARLRVTGVERLA